MVIRVRSQMCLSINLANVINEPGYSFESGTLHLTGADRPHPLILLAANNIAPSDAIKERTTRFNT